MKVVQELEALQIEFKALQRQARRGKTETREQTPPDPARSTSCLSQAHEIGREVSNNGELARHSLTEPYMQKVRLFFPKLRDSVLMLEKAGMALCACWCDLPRPCRCRNSAG